MDLNTEYYLLLIDVKASTSLPNQKVNEKMTAIEKELKKLNVNYNKDIVLPMQISYGDEVSGLFTSPRYFYNIASIIRETFYPLTTVRFSVARGKIGRISEDIRQVGGKIFKDASTNMESLKENGRFCSWQLGDEAMDATLTALCEISNLMIEGMSDYQREVFALLQKGTSQKEISDQLGKHKQSVWGVIQRSNSDYILAAERAINLNLKKI